MSENRSNSEKVAWWKDPDAEGSPLKPGIAEGWTPTADAAPPLSGDQLELLRDFAEFSPWEEPDGFVRQVETIWHDYRWTNVAFSGVRQRGRSRRDQHEKAVRAIREVLKSGALDALEFIPEADEETVRDGLWKALAWHGNALALETPRQGRPRDSAKEILARQVLSLFGCPSDEERWWRREEVAEVIQILLGSDGTRWARWAMKEATRGEKAASPP